VKRSEDRTYFKVPDSWKLFDQAQLLAADKSLSAEERADLEDNGWQTAFDASPKPSIRHFTSSAKRYPQGRALVLPLSADVADQLSLKSLRNLFFDIDGSEDTPGAKVISYDPVTFDGGFRGSHLVAEVVNGDTTYRINQIVVVDQDTKKVHALVVSCSKSCYAANQHEIEEVIDSYTVDGS
jgi:hypothetical protein